MNTNEVDPFELQRKLDIAEEALQLCEKRALAGLHAGAVMHEVNNPLEAITNLVYLTSVHNNDPQRVLEYMSIIEKQLDLVGRVTRQALSYHREQLDFQDFDLVEIVESALRLHRKRITAGGVTLKKRFPKPVVADVYASEILQVVSNLILNALDALPSQDACLQIRVHSADGAAHITISDNGHGMPEYIAAKLFEPHLTTKQSGTGLGLWLSNRIVKKHHGTLRYRTSQNSERGGTTFRISIPHHQAA